AISCTGLTAAGVFAVYAIIPPEMKAQLAVISSAVTELNEHVSLFADAAADNSTKLARLLELAPPAIQQLGAIDRNVSSLVTAQQGSDEQVTVTFGLGRHTLDDEKAYDTALLKLLTAGVNRNSELVIIGYGDSIWRHESDPEKRYLDNLGLGAKRANQVR